MLSSTCVFLTGAYISIAYEAVTGMGFFPVHLVQQAIDKHHLNCGLEFSSGEELFLAAEELAISPQKQAEVARELYLAEQSKLNKLTEKAALKEQMTPAIAGPSGKKSRAVTGQVSVSKVSISELKGRLYVLAKKNRKLRERKVCRACNKVELSTSGITFLPCGHFITCEECSEMFDDCLACGKNIMGTVRTFLS